MRNTLLAIVALALGQLGDVTTTYIGLSRGLKEGNSLVIAEGPGVFLIWKLLPIVVFTLVALWFPYESRIKNTIIIASLLSAGAGIEITFLNIKTILS